MQIIEQVEICRQAVLKSCRERVRSLACWQSRDAILRLEDVGCANVLLKELCKVPACCCSAVARDICAAMDVKDDFEIALVARRGQGLWVPCRADFDRLNIVINPQRALVQVTSRGLDAHETLLLAAWRERGWLLRLYARNMVDDREENARSERLAESPLRVLPAVAGEVLDNEDGQAEELKAQRC